MLQQAFNTHLSVSTLPSNLQWCSKHSTDPLNFSGTCRLSINAFPSIHSESQSQWCSKHALLIPFISPALVYQHISIYTLTVTLSQWCSKHALYWSPSFLQHLSRCLCTSCILQPLTVTHSNHPPQAIEGSTLSSVLPPPPPPPPTVRVSRALALAVSCCCVGWHSLMIPVWTSCSRESMGLIWLQLAFLTINEHARPCFEDFVWNLPVLCLLLYFSCCSTSSQNTAAAIWAFHISIICGVFIG